MEKNLPPSHLWNEFLTREYSQRMVAADPYARTDWLLPPEQGGILSRIPPESTMMDYGTRDGKVGMAYAQLMNAKNLVQVDTSDSDPRHSLIRQSPALYIPTLKNHAPVVDKRFDVILLCDVLQHVPEGERVSLLDELHRLLRGDDSVMIVQMFNQHERNTFRDWVSMHAPPYDQLLFLLEPESPKKTEKTFKIK